MALRRPKHLARGIEIASAIAASLDHCEVTQVPSHVNGFTLRADFSQHSIQVDNRTTLPDLLREQLGATAPKGVRPRPVLDRGHGLGQMWPSVGQVSVMVLPDFVRTTGRTDAV